MLTIFHTQNANLNLVISQILICWISGKNCFQVAFVAGSFMFVTQSQQLLDVNGFDAFKCICWMQSDSQPQSAMRCATELCGRAARVKARLSAGNQNIYLFRLSRLHLDNESLDKAASVDCLVCSGPTLGWTAHLLCFCILTCTSVSRHRVYSNS